jgi:cysteine desulfurase / selenocysteine lyase
MRSEASATAAGAGFRVEDVRCDFPLLGVAGGGLVYLDSAATAQKPEVVIEGQARFYREENANIHRGTYGLSERATAKYEAVRGKVARFLGGADDGEIVFVRGSTEGLNLVAMGLARGWLREGDEILLTEMEHHSNIVPWQMAAEISGAVVKAVPVGERGELDMEAYRRILASGRVRVVGVVQVSNALGTVNPVGEIVAEARAVGAVTVVDGAQAVPHFRVDVRELGCDFYVFSGHKLFGPTGVGVLYGRAEELARLPAYQGGGDMIQSVRFEGTSYRGVPHRFEAGTPNIAGVIGLGEAIDYLEGLDWAGAMAWEDELLGELVGGLGGVEGVRLVGEPERRCGVVSFLLGEVHAHDVGTVLDRRGVAVRAGHHCAQPLMRRLGVASTVRASVAFYNTRDDVARLVGALEGVQEIFR